MSVIRRNKLSIALLLVSLVLAGWLYAVLKKSPDQAGKVEMALPAKEIASAAQVDMPVATGKVKVYAGGKTLKKKLTLPAPVVDNDKQHVLASSKIEASDRPHTVTTVIDADTGNSQTYVRTDPLPWLAYTSKGAAGIYYGLKSGEMAIRLQARQDIVQIKAVRLGAIASFDRMESGRTDSFVGIGAEYRW